MNDEAAALDFDLACANRLRQDDNDREKRLLEALGTDAAMKVLSQLVPLK